MTNGDRIRQMSNEELALTIMCPNDFTDAGIRCNPNKDNCIHCCLEWLKEERKND